LLGGLGLPLDATRQVLFWFEPKVSWNCFDERHFPVYLIEEAGGRRLLYGFPLTGPQSEGIKVALHGSDDHCTPDSVCRDILASDERLIRERLGETVPGLSGRLIRAEVCLYTMTPDEHFVLGRHPYQPAVVLAAGFSGHGFKFAPVIGELVADLVSGDDTSTPDLFALSRFHNATMSQ
jgi:sarcosine oxidase